MRRAPWGLKWSLPLQAPGPPRAGLVSIIIGAEDEDFENELEAVSRRGWGGKVSTKRSILWHTLPAHLASVTFFCGACLPGHLPR